MVEAELPLPHAPQSQCQSTQTAVSIDPRAHFLTFSAKTCSELVHQLTPQQLDFEIKFNREVLGRDLNCRRSLDARTAALEKLVCSNIACEFDDIFYDCIDYQSLIHDFTRSIDKAKSVISELLHRGAAASADEEEQDQGVF